MHLEMFSLHAGGVYAMACFVFYMRDIYVFEVIYILRDVYALEVKYISRDVCMPGATPGGAPALVEASSDGVGIEYCGPGIATRGRKRASTPR